MTGTWRVDFTRPGFTKPNPLATGHYCGECGTRLDKAERPCPLGCKGEK